MERSLSVSREALMFCSQVVADVLQISLVCSNGLVAVCCCIKGTEQRGEALFIGLSSNRH